MEAPLSSSASSAPPWPSGSSSALHLSARAVGARMGVSTHRSSCSARIAVRVVGSSFQFGRVPALPHLSHRQISRLLYLLLIACPIDADVSSNLFLFCCLVFLWAGVRGGQNSRLGWAEKAAKVPSMIRILTCQAIPSIAWTALVWLGRTSTLVAVLPAISSSNRLPRMSKSVEQPISSSFAAMWLLTLTCDPNNTLWLAIARIEKPWPQVGSHPEARRLLVREVGGRFAFGILSWTIVRRSGVFLLLATGRKPDTNRRLEDHHVLYRQFRSSRRGHSAEGEKKPRWNCWKLSLKSLPDDDAVLVRKTPPAEKRSNRKPQKGTRPPSVATDAGGRVETLAPKIGRPA